MTLLELNESLSLNFENGIIVYLDKSNKTFRFMDPKDSKRRGLTATIKNKNDYKKLTRYYKIDSSFDEFVPLSNEFKKNNKSNEMRKVLAAMQNDILKLTKGI